MISKKFFHSSSFILSIFIMFSFVGGNLVTVFASDAASESVATSSVAMQQAAENDEEPQSEAPVSSSLTALSEITSSETVSSEIASSETLPQSANEAGASLPQTVAGEADVSSENESKEEFANADIKPENALNEGYAPSEVLVVFNEDVTKNKQKNIIDLQDGNTIQTITSKGFGDVIVAEIPINETVKEAVAEYEKNPNVAFAQPNYIYKRLGLEVAEADSNARQAVKDVANDPEIAKQWHLEAIKAQEAWQFVESVPAAPLVRVAVIDSTTQTGHEDFTDARRAQPAVNQNLSREFINGVEAAHVEASADEHATHVSGTIAAQTNNGRGVAGVADTPNRDIVEIVSLNIFDANGEAKASSVVMAINYAKSIDVKIINMSIGLEANEDVSDAVVENAINSATDAGVFCIAAGGNDNTANTSYPADFKNVCGVISVGADGQRAANSNYGAGKNVAAPGVGLFSTYQNSGYGLMGGTSAATPVVTGVAALIIYVNPLLKPAEICDILEKTASNNTKTEELAWGVINAAAAVEEASDKRIITLSKASAQLFLSKQLQLNATISPSVGDGIIEWTSSEPDIASVSASGIVIGHKLGSTVITATLTNKKTATCSIEVISPVTSVRFSQKSVTLAHKKKFALSAVVYTSDGSASKVVSFASSRPRTVSVSKSGAVTAKRVGSAVITAKTNNGKTAKITVKVVKKAVGIKFVKISGAPKTLAVGKTKYITGKMTPTNATGAKLTFKSSNKKIAIIDAAGKITAKKAGTVKFTVSAGGKKAVIAMKITKKAPSKVV